MAQIVFSDAAEIPQPHREHGHREHGHGHGHGPAGNPHKEWIPGCPPAHKPPFDGPPNGGTRADPPFVCPIPEPSAAWILLLGLVILAASRPLRRIGLAPLRWRKRG